MFYFPVILFLDKLAYLLYISTVLRGRELRIVLLRLSLVSTSKISDIFSLKLVLKLLLELYFFVNSVNLTGITNYFWPQHNVSLIISSHACMKPTKHVLISF